MFENVDMFLVVLCSTPFYICSRFILPTKNIKGIQKETTKNSSTFSNIEYIRFIYIYDLSSPPKFHHPIHRGNF